MSPLNGAVWLLLFTQGILALNDMEIAALKHIKHTWNISDWEGEPNCSTWATHLKCNEHQNVINLEIGFAKPELLSGPILDAVCNLTFLEQLKLYGNRLSGAIPSCIGNLSELRYLDLSGNCLSGEIPSSLGNLRKMEYFDLSVNHHNKFSFPHRELCYKSKLSNGLTGRIPSSLGMMKKVKYFYLSGNQLTGAIPDSIGYQENVIYMYINANNISGPLPASIGKLQNLQDLQLNKNQINGSIPNEIGNCSSLRIIQINRNNLSGKIPATIGNLAQLQALELLRNNLVGSIPEFKTTPVLDLNLFDVRYNRLSGMLPVSFRDAPLRYLFVKGNKMMRGQNGTLPDFILPDFESSSVIDEIKHFDCPGFRILSRTFQVTEPVTDIDPDYYGYNLCKCRSGYYGIPPDHCMPCLANGVCQSNSSMSFPIGYFPIMNGKSNNPQGLLACDWANMKNNPCNPNGNCLFGKEGLTATSGNCDICSQGYEERLCSKCSCPSRNSCYFSSHGECIPCKVFSVMEIVFSTIAFFVVLILFAIFNTNLLLRLLLTVAMVVIALSLNTNTWLYLNLLLLFIILIPVTSPGSSTGLMKIIILYLQTLSSVLPPPLTRMLSNLFSTINLTNIKVLGLVCIFPEFLGIPANSISNGFIVSMFSPVVVFLFLFIFLAFKRPITYCFGIRQEEPPFKKQITSVLIFIAYFAFFNASSLFISIFSCNIDPTGNSYMNAKTYQSIRCFSDEWHVMLKAAIAGCCLFILFPLFAFSILLYKFNDSLHEVGTASWLGYLYKSYKPSEANVQRASWFHRKFWKYFEVFFMIYRFILAMSISIPRSDSIWKPIGILIAFVAALPVFLFVKPYSIHTDNTVGFISLLALIFTLFVSTAIRKSAEDPTVAWVLICVVNFSTVLMFIVLMLFRGRKELMEKILLIKESIISLHLRFREWRQRVSSRNGDQKEHMVQE